MANCLRHITNKIATFNIVGPLRKHAPYFGKNASIFFKKPNLNEQYFTQVSKYCPEAFSLNQCKLNNLSCDDIVTKENVFRIEQFQRESLRDKSVVRVTRELRKPLDEDLNQNEIPEPSNKPDPEKLSRVLDTLTKDLPSLFVKSLDYSIYHPDIVFENNIRGSRTVGLYQYVKQVSFLRIIGHIKFAYVRFEILKITKHPEDSTIKLRWRIRGLPALKVMLFFWKYKLWEYKEILEKTDSWYDGFSTFHVNADGKIYKHVADKMMPDQGTEPSRTSNTVDAAKLALITGFLTHYVDINLLVEYT